MRVLLDENLPWPLRHLLSDHEVETASYAKLKQTRDGPMIARAANAGFDVIITADKGIKSQQNLAELPCAIIELDVWRTEMEFIEPLVPQILAVLDQIIAGTFVTVKDDRSR